MTEPSQPGGYPPQGGYPQPPQSAPPPYPHHPAPPPAGGGNVLVWVLAAIAALLAIGIVLALWLTGSFDRGGSKVTDIAASAPVTAPASTTASSSTTNAPIAPVTSATTCTDVVPLGDPAAIGASGTVNRLVVQRDGGGVTWNGERITPSTLRQYLDITREMRPRPLLVTSTEPGANPVVIQQVTQVIESGLGCRPARL